MSPHLDYVIKTVKQIAMFNAEFYKETIRVFLGDNYISKDNIPALVTLLTNNEEAYKYYEIINGKIEFYDSQIYLNKKRCRLETKKITDKLPSKFSSSFELTGNIIKNILDIENKDDINLDESLQEFERQFASNNCYIKNNKVVEFLSRSFFYSTEQKFWQEYIRSIVKAEYLSEKNYSENLKKVIMDLTFLFNPNKDIPVLKSFYLVKAFIKVSWLVLEFCEKNKKFISTEQKHQEQIVVNTDRQLRFNSHPIFSKISYTGEEFTCLWERLLESVVEMTDIDHRYIATNENINKLLQLWSKLDSRTRNEGDESEWSHYGDIYIDKNLFKAIKIKTAGLLYEIIEKTAKEEHRVLIFNEEDDIKEKITEYAKKMIVCDFVKNRDLYSFENFNTYLRYEKLKGPEDDVKDYNNYVYYGIEQYYENKPLFPTINTSLKTDYIFEFVERHKLITSQRLIVDLFEYVYNNDNESNDTDKIDKTINILSTLEQQLRKFIDIHKTTKISSFRPLFYSSFYKFDSENDKLILGNENDNVIFFASAGLPPIRIKWLEKKKEEFMKKMQKLYHRYDQLLSEKSAFGAKKHFDSEVKDVQKNNITTLGIFAGLITYVTSSVAFFRINTDLNTSIRYYAFFAVILIMGLGLFALFLRFLLYNNEDNKKWKDWLIILIPVLGIALSSIYFNYKIDDLEMKIGSKQNTEQSDTIQNDTVTVAIPAVIMKSK